MDRNTIIAIVLSVIVIVVGMTLQTLFMEPQMAAAAASTEVSESVDVEDQVPLSDNTGLVAVGVVNDTAPFDVQTENFNITFNPNGGTISSIKTLKHLENGNPVELLFRDPDDPDAFALYYGDNDSLEVDVPFTYSTKTSVNGELRQIVFSRDFEREDGSGRFTLEKIYTLPNADEYMIRVDIKAYTADGSALPLDRGYTISVGPQVGPSFESLGSNYDYRRVEVKYEDHGNKSNARFSRDGIFVSDNDENIDWLAISGKYFSLILIPENVDVISSGASKAMSDTGITQKDTIYVSGRGSSSGIDDTFYLYAGPKVAENLKLYDSVNDNVFDLEGMELDEVIDGNWLSWLEAILKWILQLFYRFIPNYGVAIILLTILIKLLLQPIAKRGMDSTAKMSALAPKIEEIKQKFPDNPEAQNAAMAKLYKEEKISPMGSCIPMFIQFPIFIALYGLLNTNFDLRGSMFIPGWIPDLSIPDTIYTLPFSIPFIGSQIHLLPILYVFSMIFSMKITQSTNTAGAQAGMIKFMTYGMPIIFFFVMYNAPSGLLLYWSTVNIISIGQQVLVNRKKKDVYAKEIAEKDAEKEAKKEAKRKGRRK